MARNTPLDDTRSRDDDFSDELHYALQDISHAALTTLDSAQLYRAVHAALDKLMGLPNFHIVMENQDTGIAEPVYIVDEYSGTEPLAAYVKTRGSLHWEVIEKKLPLFLRENMILERTASCGIPGETPKTWLGTPLMICGKTVGLVAVHHNTNPEYFTRKHLEILTCTADMVSMALERRQLLNRLEKEKGHGDLSRDMDTFLTLTGSMAHDFNHLINGISGHLDLIHMECGNLSKKQQEGIASASLLSRNAASLARQLQTLSRPANVPKAHIDLYEPARQAFRFLESATNPSIQKILDLAPGTYFVNGYGDELFQAFVNLGFNGIRAIEEKGATGDDFIRLYVEDEISPGRPDTVHIQFQDSGCGMPPEIKDKALMPMFSGWRNGRGRKNRGLGLSLVDYTITKRHRGSLDIQSRQGKGTLCRLRFPLSKPNPVHSKERQAMSDSPVHTVLVIEDEDMVREMTVKTLTSFGYDTLTAENGKKAVEIFQTRHRDIDAVLLDVIMPEMSGTEAFRQMLEIDPEVKVVITSGHITNQDQRKMFSKAKAYLDKPFQILELKKIMAAILS